MAGSDRGWTDGRRAWERLIGWDRDAPDRDGALDALADIGLVRRQLDQAELVAVRTARRQGTSWAEIATRLGVTRQSAWERWRDLDEEPATDPAGAARAAAAAELVEQAGAGGSRAAIRPAAALSRRRSSVKVPDVVGLSWDEARHALLTVRLAAVGADPDTPPPAPTERWVVTDQSPESGARVPEGSSVRLWLERGGGGSGVREPRHPKPEPRAGRAMRDELTDEAVG